MQSCEPAVHHGGCRKRPTSDILHPTFVPEVSEMGRIAAAAFLTAVIASAPQLAAAPATVQGEVVDVQCALKDTANKGAGHAECALSCARRGATMGILTADGVYTIRGAYTKENNRKLLEFVARRVEATGDVTEKAGKKLIDVSAMALQK
jgi:hypothetical protein